MTTVLVYKKTPAGITEIATRAAKLKPGLRNLLLLVDGKKTVADLLKMLGAGGITQASFDELQTAGFIEAALTEAPPPPTPAVAPAVAPEVVPEETFDRTVELPHILPTPTMPTTPAMPEVQPLKPSPAVQAVKAGVLPSVTLPMAMSVVDLKDARLLADQDIVRDQSDDLTRTNIGTVLDSPDQITGPDDPDTGIPMGDADSLLQIRKDMLACVKEHMGSKAPMTIGFSINRAKSLDALNDIRVNLYDRMKARDSQWAADDMNNALKKILTP